MGVFEQGREGCWEDMSTIGKLVWDLVSLRIRAELGAKRLIDLVEESLF